MIKRQKGQKLWLEKSSMRTRWLYGDFSDRKDIRILENRKSWVGITVISRLQIMQVPTWKIFRTLLSHICTWIKKLKYK